MTQVASPHTAAKGEQGCPTPGPPCLTPDLYQLLHIVEQQRIDLPGRSTGLGIISAPGSMLPRDTWARGARKGATSALRPAPAAPPWLKGPRPHSAPPRGPAPVCVLTRPRSHVPPPSAPPRPRPHQRPTQSPGRHPSLPALSPRAPCAARESQLCTTRAGMTARYRSSGSGCSSTGQCSRTAGPRWAHPCGGDVPKSGRQERSSSPTSTKGSPPPPRPARPRPDSSSSKSPASVSHQ